MGNIIIAETFQSAQHQRSRTVSDGAVGGGVDGGCGFFYKFKGVHGSSARKHVFKKAAKLPETYTAGHALSTGLGMAQTQERSSHIHGAQNGSTRRHTAQNGSVKLIQHSLRLGLGGNIKSAQLLTTSLRKNSHIQ